MWALLNNTKLSTVMKIDMSQPNYMLFIILINMITFGIVYNFLKFIMRSFKHIEKCQKMWQTWALSIRMYPVLR